MVPAPRTLSTAEARREELVEAAGPVFAARGYHGTPTTEIAKAAGISQAYLFRLFPTKLELFVAVTDRCHDRVYETFRAAAQRARADGSNVLETMGHAYAELLEDRDVLLFQLQAHAATGEPAVRDAVRRGFRRLVDLVARESGADDEAMRSFFATGMLMNVVAAMHADELDAPWAQTLCPAATT